MNTFTKTATVALAALAIIAGSLGTSSQANAFPGKKGLLGLGIAAAVIGTAAAVVTAPRCHVVERVDRWGNYRGTVEICD